MKERKRKEKINFFEISVSNLGVRIHNGKVLRNLFGALHYHHLSCHEVWPDKEKVGSLAWVRLCSRGFPEGLIEDFCFST